MTSVKAEDSWVDAGQRDTSTSLELFLSMNPDLELIKKKRDGKSGPMKWLDAAIFGFLLFSPVLPIIPEMDEPVIVVGLWLIIFAIMWTKIEYNARSEVWYTCLCRGVIIDFPKTDSLKGWLCQKPMGLAVVFILVFMGVTYVGQDPDFNLNEFKYLQKAILAGVGLLFVLLLTKGVVDIEGANHLLTVNLCVTYFQNPKLLAAQGFAFVHFSQLQKYVAGLKKSSSAFSWNDVHKLPHTEEETVKFSLMAGVRAARLIRPYKDDEDNMRDL